MAENIKSELLELLQNDAEVILALKKAITSDKEIIEEDNNVEAQLSEQNVQGYIIELKAIIENNNKTIEELKRTIENVSEENNKIKSSYEALEVQNTRLTNQCEEYKKRYSDIDLIYTKYKQLGNEIIVKMERILNFTSEECSSPEILLANGIQENNIVALWESISLNYDFYESKNKIDDLIEMLTFFVKLYAEVSYKKVTIDWPTIGIAYDERIHARTSTSKAVGIIEKTLLPGISIGKLITKKAIVQVK